MDEETTSGYLGYLPAIFSEHLFLGRYLLAFEHILTGPEVKTKGSQQGLEEIIADIYTLFDAEQTREGFLPWLADWVALSLRADWTSAQKRDFLSHAAKRYRQRGTKSNLEELLQIYTGLVPAIEEGAPAFQIGDYSTVGVNSQINVSAPYYFHISVNMPIPDPTILERQRQIIGDLIELQKPAHTTYDLTISFETMQIGERSTIGVDTLLGMLPA
jgi:phage tail-like protein